MVRRNRYDRYESYWPRYVPVAERRAKAALELAKAATATNTRIMGRMVFPPYTQHTTKFRGDLSSSGRLVLVKFRGNVLDASPVF